MRARHFMRQYACQGWKCEGGAIWETKNLTQPKANWAYGQDGVEEALALSLISPPNEWHAYRLISGQGAWRQLPGDVPRRQD